MGCGIVCPKSNPNANKKKIREGTFQAIAVKLTKTVKIAISDTKTNFRPRRSAKFPNREAPTKIPKSVAAATEPFRADARGNLAQLRE